MAYFDTDTKGLALRVTPTGAKTWYFVYRVNGSPSHWDRLGSVDGMSLADARKVARKRRTLVDDGRDPAAERRAERVATRTPAPGGFTFGDLCDLYVTMAAGQKKNRWRESSAGVDDHRALAAIHGGAYEWKDLRRTVATRLAGLGFDETCIGRVLNHARETVTGRHYNQHASLDEKRAALDDWARALTGIVSNKRPQGAAVVRFRRQSAR